MIAMVEQQQGEEEGKRRTKSRRRRKKSKNEEEATTSNDDISVPEEDHTKNKKENEPQLSNRSGEEETMEAGSPDDVPEGGNHEEDEPTLAPFHTSRKRSDLMNGLKRSFIISQKDVSQLKQSFKADNVDIEGMDIQDVHEDIDTPSVVDKPFRTSRRSSDLMNNLKRSFIISQKDVSQRQQQSFKADNVDIEGMDSQEVENIDTPSILDNLPPGDVHDDNDDIENALANMTIGGGGAEFYLRIKSSNSLSTSAKSTNSLLKSGKSNNSLTNLKSNSIIPFAPPASESIDDHMLIDSIPLAKQNTLQTNLAKYETAHLLSDKIVVVFVQVVQWYIFMMIVERCIESYYEHNGYDDATGTIPVMAWCSPLSLFSGSTFASIQKIIDAIF